MHFLDYYLFHTALEVVESLQLDSGVEETQVQVHPLTNYGVILGEGCVDWLNPLIVAEVSDPLTHGLVVGLLHHQVHEVLHCLISVDEVDREGDTYLGGVLLLDAHPAGNAV